MTAITAVRGRSRVDHILRTAARGAALIGVAVIIGIVLLQVVDKGGPVGGGSSGAGTSATTTKKNAKTTTTTKADTGRPAQEVRVLVLNGSGLAGAASSKANALRGLGYAIAGTGNSAVQQGTQVECKAGFPKEADTLAKAVGANTQVVPFASPPPEGSDNADCVVLLGK